MDPLSITAGAAGLFSLGATVCHSIITYCQLYRSRDSTLILLEQHAESLVAIVRGLERNINPSSGGVVVETGLAESIQKCLDATEVCVLDFKTLKKKYSTPTRPIGGGKAVMRQLLYPLRKEEFEALRIQLREFQGALMNYLMLLNLDLTRDLRRTGLLTCESLRTTIVSQSEELYARISAVVPTMTEALDSRLERLDRSIQDRLSAMEKAIALASLPSAQSGSGASWIETKTADNEPRANQAMASQKSPLLWLGCSCTFPIHHKSRSGSFCPIRHEEHCSLSYLNREQYALIKSLRLYKWLFQLKIQVQYSRYAARDTQIRPNFSVRAVVSEDDSPAFKIVQDIHITIKSEMTAKELGDIFHDGLRALKCLFLRKKAWPTDVTETGENLLHWAAMGGNMSFNEVTASTYLNYLKALVSMGVPLNDVACDGTPLRNLMARAAPLRAIATKNEVATLLPYMVQSMMELGAEVDTEERPWKPETSRFWALTHVYNFLPLLPHANKDLYHALGYGRISCALIEKSAGDVRRLFQHSKHVLMERGYRGETPLHIATTSPEGMQLLFNLAGDEIQSILDVKDLDGYTALDYARFHSQAVSVQLIIAAGATIDLEDLERMEMIHPNHRSAQSVDIISIFSRELAERRKQLWRLAIRHLKHRDIIKFDLRDHAIVGESSFDIVQSLRSQIVDVPSIFRTVQPGSLYHSWCMSEVLAEALFNAGFGHTNVVFEGYFPLMTIALTSLAFRRGFESVVKLVVWFEKHGADLHSRIPEPLDTSHLGVSEIGSFQIIHRIGFCLGEAIIWSKSPAQDDCCEQLRQLIGDKTIDPCGCYCAYGGCTPATLFGRGLLERVHSMQVNWPTQEFLQESAGKFPLWILKAGLQVLDSIMRDHPSRHIADATLRIHTFDRLGMKHTCCTHKNTDLWYHGSVTSAIRKGEYRALEIMDLAEVEEIQEEDRHLLVLLDSLTDEFSLKFRQENILFSEFFLGYWWKRMDEVTLECEDMSEYDIQAMGNLGVILDEQDDE